jgi:hypothetical protein
MARTKETDPNATVATYRADGRAYAGVPARDLTAADIARMKPDALDALRADIAMGDRGVYAFTDPGVVPAAPTTPSATDGAKEE